MKIKITGIMNNHIATTLMLGTKGDITLRMATVGVGISLSYLLIVQVFVKVIFMEFLNIFKYLCVFVNIC